MSKIAVFGAGGFGREVSCLIREINSKAGSENLDFIGFFDDNKPLGFKTKFGVVLGGMNELLHHSGPLDLVIAIGDPISKRNIHRRINNKNIRFPNIIAPDIRYLDKVSLIIGEGNIFFSKCSLSCNVKIGSFNIFNSSIAIGHDAILGDYNSLMPGVKISGASVLGNANLLGVYSVILQGKVIGDNNVISPGSIVYRSIKNDNKLLGNPARKIKL